MNCYENTTFSLHDTENELYIKNNFLKKVAKNIYFNKFVHQTIRLMDDTDIIKYRYVKAHWLHYQITNKGKLFLKLMENKHD